MNHQSSYRAMNIKCDSRNNDANVVVWDVTSQDGHKDHN